MKSIKYALLGLAGVIGMLVSMFGPVKVPFAEALAKSYYRYALGALLIILLLLALVIGAFIATFDANNFKAEIVQFVKDRSQRDLVLEGNIKVTFFPKLGLDSGRASLSQRNSAREFASINNTRLYIAWLPLFRHRLVFDHMEIDGIRVNLTRLKDGTTNFDDFLISDEHLAPLTFDIDSVRVTNSSINWLDEIESQRVTLQNLQLETGRLADMLPSQLTASFRLASEMAHVDADVNLKSRLFFDRKSGRYEFADIEGKLDGKAAGISGLALGFAGSLDSHPAQGSLTAENLLVTASGKYGPRTLGTRLNMPKLQLDKGNLKGSQITFDASSRYLDEALTASLQMPAFEIANKIFTAAEFKADLDLKGDGLDLQGKLATTIMVNFETKPKLRLDTMTIGLTARHPALADGLSANATGKMQADFSEQNASLDLNTTIDDSKIAAAFSIKDFSHPGYAFDISANRLDLDRYVAADWFKRFQDDATPFDPAVLKDLTLRGNLRAGEIRMAKIKASKLAAAFRIEQSKLTIAPITAKLYGGSLNGSLSIAAQGTPQIALRQNLKDIQMHALLADTAGAGKLAGRGSLALDLSAEGGSIGALRKALNGRLSLDLSRGSLAGIDLRAALLEGKGDLGTRSAAHTRTANFSEKTGFSGLRAILNIKDSHTYDSSFALKSSTIQAVGPGDVALDSGNIDYRLSATVSSAINRRTAGELADLRGVTVPVRVSGSYSAPSIALDFGSASGGNIASLATAKSAKPVAAVHEQKSGSTKTKKTVSKPVKQ